MNLIWRVAILVVAVAGLHPAPAAASAHGGYPEAAATAELLAEAPAAARPAPATYEMAPMPHAAVLAARAAPTSTSVSFETTPATGPAAAGDSAGDCSHAGPACCSMPACGAVCHMAAPLHVAPLEMPARIARVAMRRVPDPAAHAGEVALPPPRMRA
ncbi:hypothetical protein [Xanthobacter pseudotagetidis]|uniref:hypothetical protein n=1 Tax=Xanthobacter pseudotagetidis TaxID=3119911 RepID=UPI0037278F75